MENNFDQSTITNNIHKFKPELIDEIMALINISKDVSPLTDINHIQKQFNLNLHYLKTPVENMWTPYRNLIRIIAKIANSNFPNKINSINLESMACGCDFFKGRIKINDDNGLDYYGEYKWQWTAFRGYDKTFDKLTKFPNLI